MKKAVLVVAAAAVITAAGAFISFETPPVIQAQPSKQQGVPAGGFAVDHILADNRGEEIMLLAGLVSYGNVGRVEITDIDIQRGGQSILARKITPTAPMSVGNMGFRTRTVLRSVWDTAALTIGQTYVLRVTGVADNGNFTVDGEFTVPPKTKEGEPKFKISLGPNSAHAQDIKSLTLQAELEANTAKGVWSYTIRNRDKVLVRSFNLQANTPVHIVSSPTGWTAQSNKTKTTVWWTTDDRKAMVAPGNSLGGFAIAPLNSATESVNARFLLGSNVLADGSVKVLPDDTHGPRP